MAKGGKKQGKGGPADGTRNGNKNGDNECNEVSSGKGLDDAASQSNMSDEQASAQGNTGASPGTNSLGYAPFTLS